MSKQHAHTSHNVQRISVKSSLIRPPSMSVLQLHAFMHASHMLHMSLAIMAWQASFIYYAHGNKTLGLQIHHLQDPSCCILHDHSLLIRVCKRRRKSCDRLS